MTDGVKNKSGWRYAVINYYGKGQGCLVYGMTKTWGQANAMRKKRTHKFMGRSLNNVMVIRVEKLKEFQKEKICCAGHQPMGEWLVWLVRRIRKAWGAIRGHNTP